MEGFEHIIEQMKSESEKALNIIKGKPEFKDLEKTFTELNKAIETKDINKLMEISNGNIS